ncbi:MAG: BMP family ABC transporter substrate-binding protein [Proteobacteria bacterium]|nr:BMP family ABC transporter substrate-binding protein [Pseudomonadota bacterium]
MKQSRLLKTVLFFSVMAFILTGLIPLTFAKDKLKVGFVYVGPVGDIGWSYQHDLGRLSMEKELGNDISTKIIEDVPEGAEAERVIRDLAKSGYNLIFTTSFGYMNPTLKVAKLFPKTTFVHATGYKQAKNVGTYMSRSYEGQYLTGMIAGKMTKSNLLGVVAAFPIPEVIRNINAFALGAKRVNPEIKLKVIWVNSWFDPGKEREASEALIDQGVDVLTHDTDSSAPTMTAEEKGIWAVGYNSDMTKYGPNAHLTSTIHAWDPYYAKAAKQVLDGTWRPTAVWGGIKEGMIKLAPINKKVPADVVALVEKTKNAIADGSFLPFTGPIKKQDGSLVVEAGKSLTDDDLLNMNYYIEGVVGSMPK